MADVRGVLFDFGNTLFAHASLARDNRARVRGAGRATARRSGPQHWPLGSTPLPTPPRSCGTLATSTSDVWRERWHVLYALADDEVPGLGAAIYAAMHDPLQWQPYAAAAATLRRLHACRRADCRSCPTRAGMCARCSRPIGLDQFVSAFVLSYEVGAVKPSAAIFLAACDALGVPPEECLMVGDDARADAGAVAVGLRTLLLPRVEPGAANGVEAAARIVLGE